MHYIFLFIQKKIKAHYFTHSLFSSSFTYIQYIKYCHSSNQNNETFLIKWFYLFQKSVLRVLILYEGFFALQSIDKRKFELVKMRYSFWLGYFKEHLKDMHHKDNYLEKLNYEYTNKRRRLNGKKPQKQMRQVNDQDKYKIYDGYTKLT